jgi:cytochrome c oxidase cbb3-type subunit III
MSAAATNSQAWTDVTGVALRSLMLVAAVAGLACVIGCERESRTFEPPRTGARIPAPLDVTPMLERYEKNAYALANGKRLFGWYNCTGCHANGGGGSGPALMDDVWIYGSDPVTIYETLVKGRRNGMPAFGGRIPEDQIWQLVAYVRSLSGLASSGAAPNRADAMHVKKSESEAGQQTPVRAAPSGASEHP